MHLFLTQQSGKGTLMKSDVPVVCLQSVHAYMATLEGLPKH